MNYELEELPDWDDIVDQIVEQLGDREECSFIDDDLQTWEVKRSEKNRGQVVAICISRRALLRIEDC
jgi:hypothetical protein